MEKSTKTLMVTGFTHEHTTPFAPQKNRYRQNAPKMFILAQACHIDLSGRAQYRVTQHTNTMTKHNNGAKVPIEIVITASS